MKTLSRREFLKGTAAGAVGVALSGLLTSSVSLASEETIDAATEAGVAIQEGGTLVVRALGDPMSFNPDLYADDNYYSPAQNMFHRLTKLDAGKNVIPDLATSWEWSDDSLTLTFYLQDGIKWSDGEDLTSEDVKYTFETMKNEETACYFSSTLSCVDSIDAPDDLTVVFNLNTPNVALVSQLGWYATFILPEHVFNNGQSWAENEATTTSPVTSGSFTFGGAVTGESLTLVRSENAKVQPVLDSVVYSTITDDATAVQALLNGEIDVLEAVPTAYESQLLADESIRMVVNEYPSPIRIIYNFENETLQDLAVRKAIAMCINRDEISEKIFGGLMTPEYSFYPSIIEWVSNTEDIAPSYSIEDAVAVLKEAGYTKDDDGYYIRGLSIVVFEVSGYPDTAKLIAAAAEEAGIEITVESMEYNAWSEQVYTNRDFSIEMQGGFMGPDPAALQTRLASGYSDNVGNYSNEEFDELLILGGSTGDEEERATYYKEAQAILAEDLPYIPIVAYACYDANGVNVVNLPIDGADKWGWQEYTYTAFAA